MQRVMLCDWRVRLFLLSVLVCMYIMVVSLITVTRLDTRTLAERRIHGVKTNDLVVQETRRVMVKRSKERRMPGNTITWCKQLGMRAAPGPITALASFPGSGNTWLRYLIQQATGRRVGRYVCQIENR